MTLYASLNMKLLRFMPKAPDKVSSLALIRATVGMTQKEFADLAGLTRASYQQLELGKFALSTSVARRIMAATGAAGSSDTEGTVAFTGKDWKGRLYSEKSYAEWNKIQGDLGLATKLSQILSQSITAALAGAASRGEFCIEALRLASAIADGHRGEEMIQTLTAVKTITGNADWFMAALTTKPKP